MLAKLPSELQSLFAAPGQKAELSPSYMSSPRHYSGTQDAQSRKPRSTDHVSPQQGPECPLGMWVAILAGCCQVMYFFSAPEDGTDGAWVYSTDRARAAMPS